jgi:hypothetical protein
MGTASVPNNSILIFLKNFRSYVAGSQLPDTRAEFHMHVGEAVMHSPHKGRFSASLPTCSTMNWVLGWRANTRLCGRSSVLLESRRRKRTNRDGYSTPQLIEAIDRKKKAPGLNVNGYRQAQRAARFHMESKRESSIFTNGPFEIPHANRDPAS